MNGSFLLELIVRLVFLAAVLDLDVSVPLRSPSLSLMVLSFFASPRSERRSRDLDLERDRRRLSRRGLRLNRL